jgi:hypothetical protein
MRSILLAAVLLGPALSALGTPGARAPKEPDPPRLLDSGGDLAFGPSSSGPWQIAHRSSRLPGDVFLRASASGRCRLQIGSGNLYLGPDAQASLTTSAKKLVLRSGRVWLQSKAGWVVSLGSLSARLQGDASVELEIDRGGGIRGTIESGRVEISGKGLAATKIEARQGFSWNERGPELELRAMSPEEIDRLHAWIDAERTPQGLGQLVVNDPQSGSPVRLNLARYHVNVVLHPPVALVQIDQSFFNPYPRQQEGTFVFNLPEGASVSRFAMFTSPTELIEGELIDRARASGIYQSIVSRQRDPAILEQIGGNLFRMRVFPILANDLKRVLLDFTVPLSQADDGWHYFELPLMSDLAPVWDFAVTGTIRGPNVAGTARSDSHPETKFAAGEAGAVKFDFSRRSFKPQSAFAISFQQRSGEEAVARSFSAAPSADPQTPGEKTRAEPQCTFLATISPAALGLDKKKPGAPPPPADLLILADTSGATRDRPHLRRALRTIAQSLRAEDRFRLGCIDSDFRPLSGEWTAAQSDAAESLLAKFDAEFLLGETDLAQSLSAALASLPSAEAGRRRLVVYVGDGVLPDDHASPEAVYDALSGALEESDVRFCAAVLEGNPAGNRLTQKLVGATGGRLFRLDSAGTSELFGWVLEGCPSPLRIESIKAEGVVADDLFAPVAWISGRDLHVFGQRKEAGQLKLEITLERDGKSESREWTLSLRNDPDDVFVGRLWAQRKLEQLRAREALPRAGLDGIELSHQIVALSQEWTLLSPHTAFLVLEKEEDYARWGIARSLRHKYWKPADAIVARPLEPEALAALKVLPLGPQPPSADQVQKALAAARRALERRAPQAALRELGSVETSPLLKTSPEFKELRETAQNLAEQADLLRSLGPQRGLFERRGRFGFEVSPDNLARQFLSVFSGPGRDEDPCRVALAVRSEPPRDGLTIEEFAGWLGSVSGLTVWLDRTVLADEGVQLDAPTSVRGIRMMSLESMLEHVLRPFQLTYVIEDGMVKITTATRAGDILFTKLYPVTDLIQSTRATDYSLLANSDLDRELLSRGRFEEKLDRRVSVNFEEIPLEEVFDFVAGQLDDNLIIDRTTLADEGVQLETPVTRQFEDVPLRTILKQVCEPSQLASLVENEALVVTTATRQSDRLHVRLHSAQGIVYEIPHEWQREQRRKQQMMMGGMGGFGGAVGGGMGGGMMGGMGAGMMGGGGMGMAMGGFGNAPAANGPAQGGISQSPDEEERKPIPGEAPSQSAPSSPPADVPADREPDAGDDPPDQPPLGVRAPVARERRVPATTSNAIINLIENTIEPDSWEMLSGPGTILYYPGVLGFVVRQTGAIHDEIAELLDSMRALPNAFEERAGYAPVTIRDVGPADVKDWDMNSLINLFVNVIEPDTWEELSGPGSITPYRPKLVLAIRQTDAIHRQVRNLLASLRRARYLARHGRNWSAFDLASGPWMYTALGLTDLPTGVRLSELPDPQSAELEALSTLTEPSAIAQTWRSRRAADGQTRTLSFVCDGVRSEFELDDRVVRVKGDEAAVAYPRLALVEFGEWGEGVRRIVDGQLPWLPHRSRHELARLFQVATVRQDGQSVQLRLQLAAAAAGNEILVTIDRQHGLPTDWQSRLNGEKVLRLSFADLAEVAGKPIWKTVVALDKSGSEIERWELVKAERRDAGIPPLNEHDPRYALFDLRDQEHLRVPAVVQVLQAVRARDWDAAQRALAVALRAQPGQPFLLLLKAWCTSQQDRKQADSLVPLLKQVAREGAGGLLVPLVDHAFPQISDAAIYDILREQPRERRSAADWDDLARVALRLGNSQEAVEHLKAAIVVAGPDGDNPRRERDLVELLLDLKHHDEALSIAAARAARSDVTSQQLAALAETLYKGRASEVAAKFMRQALEISGGSRKERYGLLLRRADMESGIVRWRTILEAARGLPADSPLRDSAARLLLGELTDASQVEFVEALAAEADDRKLAVQLLVRQAELYVLRANFAAAAEIGWKLFTAHELPSDHFDWLLDRLGAAEKNERLVQLVEERLRTGKRLEQSQLDAAALAYEALGRPAAARRARTNSRDFNAARTGAALPVTGAIGRGMF